MALVLVTPPAVEPVTLDETKRYLRVDTTDDDVEIQALIKRARSECEQIQNRAYLTQTWQLWLDTWPPGPVLAIPRPPLRAVNRVSYYSTDDTEHVLDPATYIVDAKSQPGRVIAKSGWPAVTLRAAHAICVEFTAGNESADAPDLELPKLAILLKVKLLYSGNEFRPEERRSYQEAIDRLLWMDRVMPV